MRKRLLAQGFVCVRRVPSRLSSQRAMLFTVLLGLAAAVDMHQKVTPVQKVPATEHGLIELKKKRVSESGKFAAVADVRWSSIAQAFNQDNG